MTGKEGLIGSIAQARIDLDPDGKVFLNGEYWTAVAEDPPISAGEMVQVVSVDGFCLRVNKVAHNE